MQLDRGLMRAALPATEPDGRQTGRLRRRSITGVAVMFAAIALVLGATPAAADTVPSEPRDPQPALLLGECDATLSIADLVPGRAYDIAVRDAAGAVVYEALGLVAGADILDSFLTVPAGVHHWTVTDAAAPQFSAERTIDIAPCAEPVAQSISSPTIGIERHECDLLGASDITVRVSGLARGTYAAGVTSSGRPVPGVPAAVVTAQSSTVVFSDLPNGGTYLVWVKSPAGVTVTTASVTMPVCDLPTLDEPVGGLAPDGGAPRSPSTLPATGLPVGGLLIGATLLVAAGAGVLGLRGRRAA